MESTRVLVSGASIAGPAVAWWLHRYGFEVTLVEKAPAVRRGGQAVDFKGPVHETVLARMGVLDAVRAAAVPNPDGALVNARGRRVGTVPGAFGGGDLNIPRGDLAAILHDRTAADCEYLFGDSISTLVETTDGVEVAFEHAPPRRFDLVVGADGMHSHVRSLAFGPESEFVRHLGYYYVLADLGTGEDDVMYNEPGRMASLAGDGSPAFFVFASDLLPPSRDDVELQKRQAVVALGGGGWRMPELVARIPDSTDFHLDSISRATLDRYAEGRVVLLGDAAYGNALGGFGTGLAVVGAYVLAGELARAGGDHARAFAAYERTMRPYASVSQRVDAGRLMAPATRPGILARNALFTVLTAIGPLMRVIDRPATNIDLVDYPALLAGAIGS